jgi:hypothetical protein
MVFHNTDYVVYFTIYVVVFTHGFHSIDYLVEKRQKSARINLVRKMLLHKWTCSRN